MFLILNTSFISTLCSTKAQSDPSGFTQHKVKITRSHPRKLVVCEDFFLPYNSKISKNQIQPMSRANNYFSFCFLINISLIH